MFRKLIMALAVVGITAMPFAVTAANAVTIESTTQVANQTAGDTSYKDSVNAKVDDVVKVQVWFHNRENADSGKTANNLNVKVNIPTTPGTKQTITGTVGAANSNTVTDTATVNLSLANAHLEYIPGTAYWRHNAGSNSNVNYVTTKISDAVTGANGVLVGPNLQPCFNFESTVTVMARVKANGVSITKQVRKVGDSAWVTQMNANPGDTIQYMITFKNEGNTVLNNVIVGDNLPPHETYVAGTTMLKNGNNPSGVKIANDNIANGGINVGSYNPGAVGYVMFNVKIDANIDNGCHNLQNVGIVRPEGMNEFFNTATVKVCVETPKTPPTETPTQPLPQTGGETALAGVAGTGVLGYAVNAYRKSKRSVVDALKNIKR